jgi:hypothetical protein
MLERVLKLAIAVPVQGMVIFVKNVKKECPAEAVYYPVEGISLQSASVFLDSSRRNIRHLIRD